MADHDYIFRHTASTDGSFAVKPNSANGPASPASTILYSGVGARAVSVNTPLVLVGKGVAEYGQIVQNNLIYLAENFCNTTRPIPPLKGMVWYKNADQIDVNYPADPVTAGLYVWNGLFWNTILINGQFSSSLNLNGKRIVNVGAAVDPTDALNVASANSKYLQLSGGTISGNISVGTVTLGNVPTSLTDATSKKYVDDAVAVVSSSSSSAVAAVADDVAAINLQIPSFYKTTGGAITGPVSISGDLTIAGSSSLTLATGDGTVSMGGKVVQSVGTPILAYDAANKVYVDETIAFAIHNIVTPTEPGGADGVVSNGSLDATGTLTLTRTEGLPPVIVNGSFAQKLHSHEATEITFDPAINTQQSVFNLSDHPPTNVSSALAALDQYVVNLVNDPVRTVIKQTVVGNTTFTFPDQYEYTVWSDRLMVFEDGIKKYADTRSESGIEIASVGLQTLVGITPQTYQQDITVNTVLYSIHVPINPATPYVPANGAIPAVPAYPGTTYLELIAAIQEELTTEAVPVRCMVEQSGTDLYMRFVAINSGTGHSVAVATTAGQLFASLPTAAVPVNEIGVTYAYVEVGSPGDDSLSITFATAPPVDALLEIIVYR